VEGADVVNGDGYCFLEMVDEIKDSL